MHWNKNKSTSWEFKVKKQHLVVLLCARDWNRSFCSQTCTLPPLTWNLHSSYNFPSWLLWILGSHVTFDEATSLSFLLHIKKNHSQPLTAVSQSPPALGLTRSPTLCFVFFYRTYHHLPYYILLIYLLNSCLPCYDMSSTKTGTLLCFLLYLWYQE